MDNWLAQPQLTGTWFGARDALARWGITPTIRYAADLQANPLGGQRRGTAYAGDLTVDVSVDMEKLAGLRGLTVGVSGDRGSGTNLSMARRGPRGRGFPRGAAALGRPRRGLPAGRTDRYSPRLPAVTL